MRLKNDYSIKESESTEANSASFQRTEMSSQKTKFSCPVEEEGGSQWRVWKSLCFAVLLDRQSQLLMACYPPCQNSYL